MTFPYHEDIERAMQSFYAALPERARRHYAALEALKLGHGGIGYLATLLGCSARTIRRGLAELAEPSPLPADRQRKKGGSQEMHPYRSRIG